MCWNSTYDMLEFALHYCATLDTMTDDRDMKLHQFELSKKDWDMAAELCKALRISFTFPCCLLPLLTLQLKIFKHSTLFFSRDTPSISTVIPAMDHIDEYMAMASQDSKYSEAICAALALGKCTLNQYYDKTDYSEVYGIAMGTLSHFFWVGKGLIYLFQSSIHIIS